VGEGRRKRQGKDCAQQSGGGPPHSKTWRIFPRSKTLPRVVERAAPPRSEGPARREFSPLLISPLGGDNIPEKGQIDGGTCKIACVCRGFLKCETVSHFVRRGGNSTQRRRERKGTQRWRGLAGSAEFIPRVLGCTRNSRTEVRAPSPAGSHEDSPAF